MISRLAIVAISRAKLQDSLIRYFTERLWIEQEQQIRRVFAEKKVRRGLRISQAAFRHRVNAMNNSLQQSKNDSIHHGKKKKSIGRFSRGFMGKKRSSKHLDNEKEVAFKQRTRSICMFTRASTTFLENGEHRNKQILREIWEPESDSDRGTHIEKAKRKKRKRKMRSPLSPTALQRQQRRHQDDTTVQVRKPRMERKRKMGKNQMKTLLEEVATSLTV